ncbi:smg-9, nonsense mediated mRNA decay factor [Phytophthora boehmeriae]|uniref:Smg-9, nonsense mediated mRNA decay factor n=1 Tax=Phytophthora boehmeriae TaxID=109152 RepID=A0A8T1W2T7_9STRA|nr:smg-9, nonsense mediated mRNA decay factor [Phytophthora boehmeriae]
MASPFVSSLRSSLGVNANNATTSASSNASTGKKAMVSLFDGLDLALSESGAVVSNAGGRSAAQELIASKNAEKQAEAALAASRDLKRQQQQKQKKEQPVTALTQALGLFDQELEQRDSFVSRNQRRQKSNKKTRGSATTARGRRQRQEKYKHV